MTISHADRVFALAFVAQIVYLLAVESHCLSLGNNANISPGMMGTMSPKIKAPLERLGEHSNSSLAGFPARLMKDKRLEVDRPFMTSVANSIMDSIRDIEEAYPLSDHCSEWGGSKFMEALKSSSKEMVYNGTSSVISMRNSVMQIYHARNVSVSMQMNGEYQTKKHPRPSFTLGVDGEFDLPIHGKGGTILSEMISKKINQFDECFGHYIDYPVMLVDSNLDAWNWWFFLQGILHHYILVGSVQNQIMGNYEQPALRILFTSDDRNYRRSNLDLFDHFFSDRRGSDSRQGWLAYDAMNNNQICFSQLLWAPHFSGGNSMLVNRNHMNQACFSSIIYSYAASMKAALHIPTRPLPSKPRVVWVGRDQSRDANWNTWQKQRMISNQPELIAHLRQKCAAIGSELVVADFYGEKQDTPIQEQALFVSRANVMIGLHGAGLNMFHFMPFNSVIVEIHKGTSINKNSRNYLNHIKEGAYFSVSVQPSEKTLDEDAIWQLLDKAILKWKELNHVVP